MARAVIARASETQLMEDLSSRLIELSRTPVLLVASDFDGTLSPLCQVPSMAKPNPEAVAALHALAVMPQTHVTVISGRSWRDLAWLSGLSGAIQLVGSHGSESDANFVRRLDPMLVNLRDRVRESLNDIAATGEGLLVEEKPAAVALHYRQADERVATRAVDAIERGPASDPRIHVKRGKQVIELSVLPADKGKALASIRHRVGATAVMFIGDDETDEDVFRTLLTLDTGVKVGAGLTQALFRVADTHDVGRVLAALVSLRDAWLNGEERDTQPLESKSPGLGRCARSASGAEGGLESES